ncbi:MAG: hypothetical protein WD069_13390 [Planctomycetales bacterium]
MLKKANVFDSLDECTWLYRGVPAESEEIAQVEHFGEVLPPRPERIGEEWRWKHCAGRTETGYTSWTTDRSFAETAASECSYGEELSGGWRILRVRIASLERERLFEGRADEDEWLIEGTVENVEFSDDSADEEDD